MLFNFSQNKTMNEKILNFAKISTLAVLLAFGITQVSSWTAPTAVPPDGNVSAPINVGNATQTKAGNLTVGSLTSNGDIDVTGDNLMNVATPIAPADGVNKAYVDAQSSINWSGSGGGGVLFTWAYTDKHYFVTDTKYTGNLEGLAGADAKCNTDANAIPGKSYQVARTYPALTYDSAATANDYAFGYPGVGLYNDTYGWVNSMMIGGINGLVVNNNPSGFGSRTKNGFIVDGNNYLRSQDWFNYIDNIPGVWYVDTSDLTKNCSNWSSGSGSATMKLESDSGDGIGEVKQKSANCSNSLPLLCLEI